MLQIISRKFTMALIAMTIFSLAFALVGYTSSSEEYILYGSLFGMFVVIFRHRNVLLLVPSHYMACSRTN